MTTQDATTLGYQLIEIAGLNIPEDEAAKLAGAYGLIRERTATLYTIGGDDPAPALSFDPTFS